MINKLIPIKIDSSMDDRNVELLFFSPVDELYVKDRPLIMILPGGGYAYQSNREAESIAYQFMALGYNTAILHYTVAPSENVYPAALLEIAYAIKYFKDNAASLHICPDKIVVWGASAGGHLAALFATGYYRPEVTDYFKVSEDYLKPAGVMLAYPVITSGEFAHRGSFDNLLGAKKNDPEVLAYVSIENRVNDKAPAAFIWHTFADGTVPVENSLLLANAYRKAGVPFELHIFPTGGHGLALANEMTLSNWKKELDEGAQQWVPLAGNWLKRLFGPIAE